jgi:crotonobetainyl-CoA:carnitine CoA-transferase CaiB-like acyl-CoA transferase
MNPRAGLLSYTRAITAPGEKPWAMLCGAMAHPDLINDRKHTNPGRAAHAEPVLGFVSQLTKSHTITEIVGSIRGKVSVAPANAGKDIFGDRHTTVRKRLVEFGQPGDNPPLVVAGCLNTFSRVRTESLAHPPKPGRHAQEVLAERETCLQKEVS